MNLLINFSKSKGKELKKNNASGTALYTQGAALVAAIELNKYDNSVSGKFYAMAQKLQKTNWKWGQFEVLDEAGKAEKLAKMELAIDEFTTTNDEYIQEVRKVISNVKWDDDQSDVEEEGTAEGESQTKAEDADEAEADGNEDESGDVKEDETAVKEGDGEGETAEVEEEESETKDETEEGADEEADDDEDFDFGF